MRTRSDLSTHSLSGDFCLLKKSSRYFLLLAVLSTGFAGAGELLPYDPPRSLNRAFQGGVPDKDPSFSQFDSLNRKFIRDTERLPPQERSKFVSGLRELQQEAIRERQWDAVKYYDQLFLLLNKKAQ
jgi:hypothetical protein